MTESTIQNDLKSSFFISSADVDFQATLRPSALVNFLIQTAWQHAEILGWGINDLLKHNLVWVLSGLKLQIDSYPKWKDKIQILTWPKGINRLFYLRDFLIYNANNKEIGRATSNWLLIDINKRRPKMHDLNNEVFSFNLNRHAINEIIPALNSDFQPDKSLDYNVRYSDIDVNHHLTTTRYIDLVMDMFPPEIFVRKMPVELTMNFSKEVIYGKKVIMQNNKISELEYQFRLMTEEHNKPHFICRLSF